MKMPNTPHRYDLTITYCLPKLVQMRSNNEQQNSDEHFGYRDLQILSEVDSNPEVTQRQLSSRMGIALGLTNLLMRNLAEKGYIRVAQASWKRRLYNLTPDGLSHKIRLTAAYILRTLDHYKRVRQTLRGQLEPLALHEESRIAICGTGDFAELVYLGLKEYGIEEIAIFDSIDGVNSRFLGMVVQDMAALQPDQYDRIVIAHLGDSSGTHAELRQQGAGEDRLVTFFKQSKGREEG